MNELWCLVIVSSSHICEQYFGVEYLIKFDKMKKKFILESRYSVASESTMR